jgi:hypothetical protein
MITEIETGQVYLIKETSKHKENPMAKFIKIGDYFQDAEDKHKIKNLWNILIRDTKDGEWKLPTKHVLFKQQIEAHYNLELPPLSAASSKLSKVED